MLSCLVGARTYYLLHSANDSLMYLLLVLLRIDIQQLRHVILRLLIKDNSPYFLS